MGGGSDKSCPKWHRAWATAFCPPEPRETSPPSLSTQGGGGVFPKGKKKMRPGQLRGPIWSHCWSRHRPAGEPHSPTPRAPPSPGFRANPHGAMFGSPHEEAPWPPLQASGIKGGRSRAPPPPPGAPFLTQNLAWQKSNLNKRPLVGPTHPDSGPPRVTFRRVVVPLRGPGQSPVLPFACCVGSLLSDGRCGRCSCWCRFRVRGAQWLVCRGCAGCGGMCRLRVSGDRWRIEDVLVVARVV